MRAREVHHDIMDFALQASAEILFFKGQFSGGGEGASTSGRTGHVEYCRTFGVLLPFVCIVLHSCADASVDQA